MCDRLARLLKTAYDDNWSELSQRLGYASASGMLSVKRGDAFPDVQRLNKISDWEIEGGYIPSLDWILTNKGPAVIKYKDSKVINGLTLSQLASLRVGKRAL